VSGENNCRENNVRPRGRLATKDIIKIYFFFFGTFVLIQKYQKIKAKRMPPALPELTLFDLGAYFLKNKIVYLIIKHFGLIFLCFYFLQDTNKLKYGSSPKIFLEINFYELIKLKRLEKIKLAWN